MGDTVNDRLSKKWLKQIEEDGSFIDLEESGHKRAYELEKYYVGQFGNRTSIPASKIKELEACIQNAKKEEEIQQFLQQNPQLLTRLLLGNHGSWCIPKPQLGCQHVPDFLIAELDSMGFRWYGVELESTKKKMYTKDEIQHSDLTEALNQIDEWRIWLKYNIDYAQRPLEKKGLSLIDIDCNIPCVILIGRRKDQVKGTREKRKQIANDKNVEVHHYDWLVERAKPSRYKPKIQDTSDYIEL